MLNCGFRKYIIEVVRYAPYYFVIAAQKQDIAAMEQIFKDLDGPQRREALFKAVGYAVKFKDFKMLDFMFSRCIYYLAKVEYISLIKQALEIAKSYDDIETQQFINNFFTLFEHRIKYATTVLDLFEPNFADKKPLQPNYILSPLNHWYIYFKIIYGCDNGQYNVNKIQQFQLLSLFEQEQIVCRYGYSCLVRAVKIGDLEAINNIDRQLKSRLTDNTTRTQHNAEDSALVVASYKLNFDAIFCLLNNIITLQPHLINGALEVVKTNIKAMPSDKTSQIKGLVENYSRFITQDAMKFQLYLQNQRSQYGCYR